MRTAAHQEKIQRARSSTAALEGVNSGEALLAAEGWKGTRAGRYIDPVTSNSHTGREAWAIINERTKR